MPDRHRVLVAAERYLKHGWKLLPLVGKEPAVINNIRLGVKHATSKLERIRSWIRAVPNMNIGGTPPANTAIIDVDYYKDSPNLLPVAKELSGLGGPVQFTPSGGAHFLFQHPVPPARELCQYYGVAKGIDVKAHAKGYVVLAPSTFEGKQYRWKHGRGIDLLVPALSEDIINGYDHHLVKDKDSIEFKDFTTWAQERQKVRAALKVIEPDINYNEWLTAGQALHSIDPDPDGPAFKKWDTWSSAGGKYKTGEPARKWKTFKQGGGVTIATLYDMASHEDSGWRDKIKTKQRTDDDEDTDALVYRPLSEYKAKAVDWILPGVLARGQLTVLAGQGGQGKSTFAARITHMLIHGGYWPAAGFDHQGADIKPAGDVIEMIGEEDIETGVVPRYDIQGTDRTHTFLIGDRGDDKTPQLVRLDEDLERLKTLIRNHRKEYPWDVALVKMDPITAYLGETDQNSEAHLREILTRIGMMARSTGVAILALAHLNKKSDLEMVDRIMGGKAFANVARHVMIMGPYNDNPDFRYCVVSKTNIGEMGMAFVLRARRAAHPETGQMTTVCEVESELDRGVDIDSVMRQTRHTREEILASTQSLSGWIVAATATTGTRGIEFETLAGVVRENWRTANPDRELSDNFEQMVHNALRTLKRRRLLLPLFSQETRLHRRGRTPITQRYFTPENYNEEFSQILN